MPTIRIAPGQRRQSVRQNTAKVGALIGQTALPLSPVIGAIGAFFGDAAGAVISHKEPTYGIEIETESNQVRLLAPDYRNSVNTKTRALAPRMEKRDEKVRAALQAAWDTGTVPGDLPKRYRDEAQELLSQRELLRVTPTEPETFTQYGSSFDMPIVPPGGFAGFAQMTPASKAAQGLGGLLKSVKRYTRKKGRKKKAGGRKRKASGTRKRSARKLVKGSAAAKRFMAALRRKRK